MNRCMYVCMYVLYAYIRVCMHLCAYVCMYICMHVCIHACMHVIFKLGFERCERRIVLVGRGNCPGDKLSGGGNERPPAINGQYPDNRCTGPHFTVSLSITVFLCVNVSVSRYLFLFL